MKLKSHGKPVVIVLLYSDDFSGNRTKNGIALMLGLSCLLDFPNKNAQFENMDLFCVCIKKGLSFGNGYFNGLIT